MKICFFLSFLHWPGATLGTGMEDLDEENWGGMKNPKKEYQIYEMLTVSHYFMSIVI